MAARRTLPEAGDILVVTAGRPGGHVRAALEWRGYVVREAAREHALRALYAHRPDCVVLDATLGGLAPLAQIRELTSEVPVLVIAPEGGLQDRLEALAGGADGVAGPGADARELVARVDALVRRARRPEPRRALVVDTGWLRLDPVARQVSCGGRPLHLSEAQFRLLEALAAQAGGAVPADDLLRVVWPPAGQGRSPHSLQLLVCRLRGRLGVDPRTGRSPVETVRGFGYRLPLEAGGAGSSPAPSRAISS